MPGVVAGATYGGVPGSSLGFGSAWNGTPNGLEEYGPALNDTLIFLDETSLMPSDPKGRPLAFGEALMRLMQGQGKKRHGLSVDRWSAPVFSSSNSSVYALLDPQRRKNYPAYTDRLMDIPTPKGKASFFENLHGFKDAAAFGKYLFDLATTNYGYPIRVFLDRLTSALARDRAGLVEVVAGNVAKYEAAAAGIASPLRDVLRVRGYFATVYAVGCLAIRLKVLPFTEAELLAAILSCHRDHVAFVDNEVAGGPGWTAGAVRAQEVVAAASAPKPIAGAVVPAATALRPFATLSSIATASAASSTCARPAASFGLIPIEGRARPRLHRATAEYWLPGDRFEQVAGGAREALALKQDLVRRGLLETARRGATASATWSSGPCRMARGRSSSSFGTRGKRLRRWVRRF